MTIGKLTHLAGPQITELRTSVLAKKGEMDTGKKFTIVKMIASDELPDLPDPLERADRTGFTKFFLDRMQPVQEGTVEVDSGLLKDMLVHSAADLGRASALKDKGTETRANLTRIIKGLHEYAAHHPKTKSDTGQPPSPGPGPGPGPSPGRLGKALMEKFEKPAAPSPGGAPGGAPGGSAPKKQVLTGIRLREGGNPNLAPGGGPPAAPPTGPPAAPPGGPQDPNRPPTPTEPPAPTEPPTPTEPPAPDSGARPIVPPKRGSLTEDTSLRRSTSFHSTEKDAQREEAKNKDTLAKITKKHPDEVKYTLKRLIESLDLRKDIGSTSEKEKTRSRLTDLRTEYAQNKKGVTDDKKPVSRRDLKTGITETSVRAKTATLQADYPTEPFLTSTVQEAGNKDNKPKIFPAPFTPGTPFTHLELTTHADILKNLLKEMPPFGIDQGALDQCSLKMQLNIVAKKSFESPFINSKSPLQRSCSDLLKRLGEQAIIRDTYSTDKETRENKTSQRVTNAFDKAVRPNSPIPQGSPRAASIDMLSARQAECMSTKEVFMFRNSTDFMQTGMHDLQIAWTGQAIRHLEARQEALNHIKDNYLKKRLSMETQGSPDVKILDDTLKLAFASCETLLAQHRGAMEPSKSALRPLTAAIATRNKRIGELDKKITAYSNGIKELGALDTKGQDPREIRKKVGEIFDDTMDKAGVPVKK